MKTENTFPTIIEEQIKSSGISELSKAQEIAINYVPFLAEIDEQSVLLKKLEKGNKEHVKKANRIKLDLGNICSRVEFQKKTDKKLLLIVGGFIDGLFKTVNGAARLTQHEAKEIELHFERQEKERVEKLQIERANQLSSLEMVAPPSLGEMEKDVWANFLSGVKLGYEIKKEAELKAEEEKIKAVKLDKLEKERERILLPLSRFDISEADLRTMPNEEFDELVLYLTQEEKKDRAEQERIKKENERLKKEADDRKTLAAIEAKKLAAIETQRKEKERKQQEKYEAEIRAEREEKERIELEEYNKRQKLEAELKVKKDVEAHAIASEELRIQIELKKGDSDKVDDLKYDLVILQGKYSFKSQKSQKMYSDVKKMINSMIVHIDKYN